MARCKSVRSPTSGSSLSTHSRLTSNERGARQGLSELSLEDDRGERRRRRNKRKASRSSPETSGGGGGGGERKRRGSSPETSGGGGGGKRRRHEEEEEVEEEEEEGDSSEALSSLSSLRETLGGYATTLQAADLSHSRALFEEAYGELGCLGRGGFGTVYAGYRRQDNLPVAIKHVPITMVDAVPVALDGHLTEIPLEVAMLLIVGGGPGGQGRAPIGLLDWYELDQEVILVLEWPVPSMDLFAYIQLRGGCLQEDEAKMFLRQLVRAMMEVHSKGVLHRDIKPENVLVETGSAPGSQRLRVLDFGCGCVLREGLYTEFSGTSQYAPPELFVHGSYEALASTVWQLGVLLYVMLCGELPFYTHSETVAQQPHIQEELSTFCQDLLLRCLAKSPRGRPTLEGMLLHPWLQ